MLRVLREDGVNERTESQKSGQRYKKKKRKLPPPKSRDPPERTLEILLYPGLIDERHDRGETIEVGQKAIDRCLIDVAR